jgi:hypothetical protein
MGWNSWNKFGCDVSEKLIMEMTDAMVISGMQDAGYEYIVIDDCWQVDQDENGEIMVDRERFPHGMKYLVDYIHSKGLKFGIYSGAGTKTCQGRPVGRGYEYQDARTYARWGVDYLKYDWCTRQRRMTRLHTPLCRMPFTRLAGQLFLVFANGGSLDYILCYGCCHPDRVCGIIPRKFVVLFQENKKNESV